MANGENPSTESEEYVLRSTVRSGLKREFAFALKAQAELPASLCRTRSGKSPSVAFPSPPAASHPRVRKWQKKSGGDMKAASPAAGPSMSPGFNLMETEAPLKLNSEGPDINLETSSEVETPVVVTDCEDYAIMDACESKNEASIGTTAVEAILDVAEPKNGADSNTPFVIEGHGESAPASPVKLIKESFKPMRGSGSEFDLIPVMVQGEVNDEDYRGMHCAVLSNGSSVASNAIFRVLGSSIAELPLVATRREHQGLGYLLALFSCIERLLASLNVKHFLLPAAYEAESLWIRKCGLTRIRSDQLQKCLNGARMMSYSDTSVFHKLVPRAQIECQGEQDRNDC